MGNQALSFSLQEAEGASLRKKAEIVWRLSVPGILAQISEIIMEYIDSAMVGSLGAAASASIGLVASSTWLVGGIVMSTATGFNVQIAHAAGAEDPEGARRTLGCGVICSLILSLVLCAVAAALSPSLPVWLGGAPDVCRMASSYFGIYAAFLPVRMMFFLHTGAMQCTGDMKTPSLLTASACGLDVFFNLLLIFPGRRLGTLWLPGAGLGVAGASLGTQLSFAVMTIPAVWHTWHSSPVLSGRTPQTFRVRRRILREAVRIGGPMALAQSAMSGAQVFSTHIVAPLGTESLAANSFAVTAEALCYMPGYGIGQAATTLVGQAYGARRKELARSFAWLTTLMSMAIMAGTGVLMYFLCPFVFDFLTPVQTVRDLGVRVLRIELLAEPLFAVSITGAGALRGAGDTLIPGLMNLAGIWGVRIPLASYLAPRLGLAGVWTAMCTDLVFRGVLFLIRLKRERWLHL